MFDQITETLFFCEHWKKKTFELSFALIEIRLLEVDVSIPHKHFN